MNKEIMSKKALEAIRSFRLIDDTFMSIVLDDKDTAEFLIQLLLNNDTIEIEKVKTQNPVKSLTEHSVIFDCFAKDKNGNLYDIEIQRAIKGAAPKRARYNSAMLDAESLPKGQDYSEMRESYVIFITEDDFFNKGLAAYHIERKIEELNNEYFNDGSHILYVNSQYQEDNDFGRLMRDFYQTDANEIYHKPLADRVRYFKEDNEGVRKMCKISEDLINEGKAEIIAKMISNGLSYEEISQYIGLSVEEIKKLVKMLSVH